ncbi:MAG: hypothetical protein L6V93_17800 [Clostridiales bacterium]|nr:MAG: hypothetical protein L6V93_17800 [Clostridiales bacterium]
MLNPNNIKPYYTAATAEEAKRTPFDELEVAKRRVHAGKNCLTKNTFEVVNNNINWIEDGFNYVGTGTFKNDAKADGFNAKFAVSYTDKGFLPYG